MSDASELLQKALTHSFVRPELLGRALTHRSAAKDHNERLEFLGDSVLGFLIADYLYENFPEATEGELSRMRASLVKRSSLALIARKLDLGECLHLGSGERSSGGAERDSILADGVEAIIAAIYLDGGLDASRRQVYDWAAVLIKIKDQAAGIQRKDPKTQLQELMQAEGLPLPVYTVLEVSGEAHNQLFTIACALQSAEVSETGQGVSKRIAQQQAAQKMIAKLQHKIDEPSGEAS
jgi:ribonuclease-3